MNSLKGRDPCCGRTCSFLSIWLLPTDRHSRALHPSKFSSTVILLLNSDRSLSLVSEPSPSILEMRLKDRSAPHRIGQSYVACPAGAGHRLPTATTPATRSIPSQVRFTRCSRFSILRMWLLSNRSTWSRSMPTRLSIPARSVPRR